MAAKRKYEMGPDGRCICPKCDEKIDHRRGTPCQDERCPSCGAKMLREGSYHHRLFEEKQAKKRQPSPGATENESS